METGRGAGSKATDRDPADDAAGLNDISGDAPGDWAYRRSDRSKRNGPLRRRFRTLRRRATAPLVPALVPPILRAAGSTWRLGFTNVERRKEVLESSEGCIALLWHGRMAVAAPVFRGVDAAILVSRSGDGDMANVLLSRLGYETLRGSTGKVGAAVLQELRGTLAAGRAIAITPDGPRGPRHHVNRGAAFLARATGRPILPIGFAASRGTRLNSWDRFLIPSPFARVHVHFGAPVFVEPSATDEALMNVSADLGRALIECETSAHGVLGVEVDW